MTFGLLGSFHICDKESHAEYSILFDEADYLYSIRTFALKKIFVTGSKSYLSTFTNGIGPLFDLPFRYTIPVSIYWNNVRQATEDENNERKNKFRGNYFSEKVFIMIKNQLFY